MKFDWSKYRGPDYPASIVENGMLKKINVKIIHTKICHSHIYHNGSFKVCAEIIFSQYMSGVCARCHIFHKSNQMFQRGLILLPMRSIK